MGWRETCAMDERMRFAIAVEKREEPFAAICRRFGVSRKAGYKWLARYREAGVEGLLDRSRAPVTHPQAVLDEIGERCVAVRRAHPTWGPVKVRGLSRAAGAFEGLAGGEHDRAHVRSRGADGEAQAAPKEPALERTLRALRGGQRRVVYRLQGLVLDRRRRPLRAADPHRRDEPLSLALSGAGEVRRRACLAGARRRVPRVRPAAQASLRQRLAVRLHRLWRAVAPFGSGGQGPG